MAGMFYYARSFNGDLSKWDVSRVTEMQSMFYFASSFNGGLSEWDVSTVTDMTDMFAGASSFTQILCGKWKTSTAKKDKMFDGSSGRFCWGQSKAELEAATKECFKQQGYACSKGPH